RIQSDRRKGAQTYLYLTILLAAVFLGVKAYEYAHKWETHLVPGRMFEWSGTTAAGPAELFFSFYFVMTGVPAAHMLVGMGALIVLAELVRRGRYSSSSFTPLENVGLYWHFVDCIWVFLFPLLYLIDRA